MKMITNAQVDIEREYVYLALEAVAQVEAGIPHSITEFTTRVTDYIPVKMRYRLDWPMKPHDRWNWIVSNSDQVITAGQEQKIKIGRHSIVRNKAQVVINWDTQPASQTVEWTREDAQALIDAQAQAEWAPEPVDDSDAQEALAEVMAAQAYSPPHITLSHDNEWMPRPDYSEYSGGALGANERIVNMRVYTNGWVTHAVASGISEMIDHDVFRRIQFKIKFDLGIYGRPAHVPRFDGRGGYWVVYPDVFHKEGISFIQNVIREAYAANGYNVLFSTSWVEAEFADEDRIR